MLNVLFGGESPVTKLFSNDLQPVDRVKVEFNESQCESFEARLGAGTAKKIEVKGRGRRLNIRDAPFWPLEDCTNGLQGAGILCVSASHARNAGKKKSFSARLQYTDSHEVPVTVHFLD